MSDMLLIGNDAEFNRCSAHMERVLGPNSKFRGRPHWGKIHTLSYEQLASSYPKWEAFRELMASTDPAGVFSNDYITALFARPAQNETAG